MRTICPTRADCAKLSSGKLMYPAILSRRDCQKWKQFDVNLRLLVVVVAKAEKGPASKSCFTRTPQCIQDGHA
eukprot:m.160235 g.160235  ORF g.160235 m.160235 type:complete len:73 (+) comp16357_c1_seq1:3134-3352(+)